MKKLFLFSVLLLSGCATTTTIKVEKNWSLYETNKWDGTTTSVQMVITQ